MGEIIGGRQPWMLDTETGFPLSLYPTMDAPNVYTRSGELYHKDPDEHHIFHTKRGYSEPNAGPGGAVVRFSRIQTVRRFHHDNAHRLLEPPQTIQQDTEQFDTSVLALMNFIPREVIDVRGQLPVVRILNDDEYALLRELTRADFSRGFHSAIGKFFIQTTLHHHHEVIDDDLRCQFLEAQHKKVQRRNIGNRILKLVVSEAVEPLLPHYAELKKSGEIPPWQKSPYKTVLQYTRAAAGSEKIIANVLKAA